MTALRILGYWVAASLILAGLWAAYRAAVGDIESPADAEMTCPGCDELARQLAAANEHVRLLERANAGLAAKVDDMLVRRRRGVAS